MPSPLTITVSRPYVPGIVPRLIFEHLLHTGQVPENAETSALRVALLSTRPTTTLDKVTWDAPYRYAAGDQVLRIAASAAHWSSGAPIDVTVVSPDSSIEDDELSLRFMELAGLVWAAEAPNPTIPIATDDSDAAEELRRLPTPKRLITLMGLGHYRYAFAELENLELDELNGEETEEFWASVVIAALAARDMPLFDTAVAHLRGFERWTARVMAEYALASRALLVRPFDIPQAQKLLLDVQAIYREHLDECTLRDRLHYAFTYNTRGLAQLRAGNTADAIALVQTALAMAEDMPAVPRVLVERATFLYNLFQSYQRTGDEARARTYLARAQAVEPDFAAYDEAAGRYDMSEGRYERAAQSFRSSMEIAPPSASLLLNLANSLAQVDEVDEAVSVFERLRRGFPEEPGGYLDHIDVLLEHDRLDDIPDLLAAYARRFGVNDSYRYRTALVALYEAKYAEGIALLEELLGSTDVPTDELTANLEFARAQR